MPKKKGTKKRTASRKKGARKPTRKAAPKKTAKKHSPKKTAPKKSRSKVPKPAYKASFTKQKPSSAPKSADPQVKLEVRKAVPQGGARNVHHFTAHLFLLCALIGFVFAVTFAFTQDWLLFFLALLIMIIGLDNMALGLRKHKESVLR